MAALMGLGGAKANRPIQYSGLNISSSKMDTPIPIFWGMRRLTTNAIWYNNFQKHALSKLGGKGGGKTGQYDYTAAVILALCEGPVDLIQNIWGQASTTTTTTLSKLNMSFFSGTASQAPWSYVVSNYPSQARSYAYTAGLTCPKLDLGEAAEIPDNQFECKRVLSFSYVHSTPGYIHPDTLVQDTGYDVLLSDVISDWLTSTQYGMGFTSGDLGSLTQCAAYWRAQGIFLSPVLDTQETATSVMDRWAQLGNSWIYWAGTQLMFYPLADAAITGNGVTFTPQNDVAYSLTADDFIPNPDLVKISRIDPADAYNRTRLNISDRTLGYVSNPKEYKDQTLVDLYGLRDNSTVDGKDVCDPAVGLIIAQLIGKRAAYIRNTYSFKTNYRFVRCLPGTILALNEPNIPLVNFQVRVRTVTENADDTLSFVCEEFPGTVASYGAFDPTAGTPASSFPNQNTDPGNVNTPAVIEPSSAFTGGTSVLLISASGGANWGGCQVNISFDGTDYTPIGDITTAAAQGLLTANFASHADPDSSDTLSVDCTQSLTVLPAGVTSADADALRTLTLLCAQPTLSGGIYVLPSNGELIAWGTPTPTGTYSANMTYTRRGQYGTAPASHSIGDQFSAIDVLGNTGTTLRYQLPAQYIGATIYLKFCSRNNFGNALQDITMVLEYSYTPTGAGYGGGTAGVPKQPTGLSATGGVQQIAATWNANASTDNVTQYQLWAAAGSSVAFGSCSLIASTNSLDYTMVGLLASQTYTLYVVAVNSVGSSSPSAGVNVATLSTSVTVFGVSWTCADISTKALNAFMGGFSAGISWKLPATTSTPAGFAEGKVLTAPSSDTVIDLQKDGISVGSIKFASGSTTPTLIKAADSSFALGDYLDMIAPASWNGMAGAFRLTIMGTR